MTVDVIMRSKNSARTIGQALVALFSQRNAPFTLLVVDSGSTDDTLNIIRRYPHRLVRTEPEAYHPGAVLNDAMSRTRSDVVAFHNSDAVPTTPFDLERLLLPLRDPSVDATFARQVPQDDAEPWVRRDYEVAFPSAGEPPAWMYYSLPFATVRRTAWMEHPFYVDAWASEDTEWGHWARLHGRCVRYVPRSVVVHSHNYSLRQLYGRRFVEGEADAFIFRGRYSLARMLSRAAKSILLDMRWQRRSGALHGVYRTPVIRAVYHWAYYKGHRLGRLRIGSGSSDVSTGQRIVLARHDSTNLR